MLKWYENMNVDSSPIISARVRLARNIAKYPFSIKLHETQAQQVVQETVQAIKNDRSAIGDTFTYVDMAAKNDLEKHVLLEKHIISPELLKSGSNKGVLIQNNETVNILVNEEDHIRIQAIYPGDQIDETLDMANKIDDLIEESIEYAYDKDFGYLTSCPTNTGTGLRASFMLHLPMLEKTEQLRNVMANLSKFGMTVRGIYGEGSESLGSIYQISNQLTLGKSEEDIVASLKNVTRQIVEKEQDLMEKGAKMQSLDLVDSIYRSYGILTNSRKISAKEAMYLLSNIRLGFNAGILDAPKPDKTIYHIMMNIQLGNLQTNIGKPLSNMERDIARADYIRTLLKQ